MDIEYIIPATIIKFIFWKNGRSINIFCIIKYINPEETNNGIGWKFSRMKKISLNDLFLAKN